MIELQAIIKGKVQGVRYRDYIQVSAMELGLFGYTKNNSDGSVFVLAQGAPDILKSLVEHLHEGSVLATVESVSVDWATAGVTYDDFSVLQ